MLEIDSFLSPIRDDAPAGEDLRLKPSDVTFQTIIDARTVVPVEDDPGGEGRNANWVVARRTCEEALTSKTKDLEIAAWLTEAMAQTEGFAGLDAGIQLITKLVQTFWQHIHPGVDEDDGEISFPIRARPLTWIGTSKEFLRSVNSCTIVTCGDGRRLNWGDYTNSELVDEKKSLSDQTAYSEMIESGYISGDDWTSRIKAMDPGSLRETLTHVRAAEASLTALRAACDELFTEDGPNFVNLGGILMDVREYLETRTSDSDSAADAAGDVSLSGSGGVAATSGAGGGPATATGAIGGREDALRRLTQVADYFRRTEPHSPISHLIQRTVRWGHMPLPDLLKEIVKDDDVLSRIWDTLGILGGPDSGNSSGGRSDSDDD